MSIPVPSTVEVPVLIVGAGPAGLALSATLSRYGVGHLLVERHRGTAHTPRAHIINQRTSRSSGTWDSATGFTRSPRRST